MKLLLISYLFPPNGGIGVQRALSLAKYLPSCDFTVHVLKATNASGPVRDPALMSHVPPDVRVHGAVAPEIPFALRHKVWGWLSRSRKSAPTAAKPAAQRPPSGVGAMVTGLAQKILCPEPEVLWVPFAVRKASRIIQKHKINVVLLTAPPFSIFLVGNALKRKFPSVKLVSDFRDEWLKFYLKDFDFQNSDYTRRRAAQIERETAELSDLIVVVTESTLAEMRARYADLPSSKFMLIPNGYDAELFKHFEPRPHGGSKIVITHAGTVYRTSSAKWFLDALEELPEAVRSRFEIRFIGRVTAEEAEQFEGRNADIRLLGFMPQAEALRRIEETDFLLVTLTDAISIPGKLFEYLATGKPILALSDPGGEVDSLIRRTNAGWCVDARDREAIKQLLVRVAEQGGPGSFAPDLDMIRRYSRSEIAAEYANIMRQVVEGRKPEPAAVTTSS